ncbi:heme-binding beta-barrel domain-containing protein [Nisaea sp.]|uniref:heme-binding beta-barrel domain-containing protein n=1 Tax=Nisaea sp. TaxID=2024842 RepID=UPI00329847F8
MGNYGDLGPLSALMGEWYGNIGKDVFPLPSPPGGEVKSKYVESTSFMPIAPVANGPQTLSGLQYKTTLIGDNYTEQEHQEVGYYLYNPSNEQLLKTFAIPRGEAILALGREIFIFEDRLEIPDGLSLNDVGRMAIEDINKNILEIQRFPSMPKLFLFQANSKDKSFGILNTPYLDKYFNITQFAAIMMIQSFEQEQKSPFGGPSVKVHRTTLTYNEYSALEYTPGANEVYHLDSNTLWKQV